MRVICTGQSGLRKLGFLKDVQRLAQQHGKELTLYDVGDLMYGLAPKVARGKILDLDKDLLDRLRCDAFDRILHQSESKDNVIVCTHIVMRWRFGLFPAFDFRQLVQFNPDMYITLIDDVDAIKLELSREEESEISNLTLKDIMVWREEELVGTEIVARSHMLTRKTDVPHYVIAKGHGPAIVYQLIFEGHKKKAYASFPMTLVEEQPDVLREIDEFRKELKKHLIVFDPGTNVEKRLHTKMVTSLREMSWTKDSFEVETAGQPQKLSVWEVSSIVHDIDGQIIARDYKLIDQSDMIIAFIPAGTGQTLLISAGVERELQHAHQTAKEVFVVCPKPELLSPFDKITVTKVFRTFDELIKDFCRRGYIS